MMVKIWGGRICFDFAPRLFVCLFVCLFFFFFFPPFRLRLKNHFSSWEGDVDVDV